MKLKAKWEGDPPKPGEYLMSRVNPRFAYMVLVVGPRDAEGKYTFLVGKTKLSDVPDDAVVHGWKWDSRAPKKGVGAR